MTNNQKKAGPKKITALEMSRTAWHKIIYCMEAHTTEVGGFGISRSLDEIFDVIDFQTVKQKCTAATIEFDDDDVCRMAEEYTQQEIWPVMCQKIWIHTHPGNSCTPSSTDEDTFSEMLDKIEVGDWLIMLIFAKDYSTYCRLSYKTPMGIISTLLPVKVYDVINEEWEKEFKNNITKKVYTYTGHRHIPSGPIGSPAGSVSNYTAGGRYIGNGGNTVNTQASKTKLDKFNLAYELFKRHAKEVDDLGKKALKKFQKEFDVTLKELYDIELELEDMEAKHVQADYQTVLNKYSVISVKELTHQQWKEVCEDEKLRPHVFVEYEAELDSFDLDEIDEQLENIYK